LVKKQTWSQFHKTGLLWWVNRSLHLFGWAICIEIDDKNDIIGVFPARVKFRGFNEETESENFITLSEYMVQNAYNLREEAKKS
jgi:hypothetical protein